MALPLPVHTLRRLLNAPALIALGTAVSCWAAGVLGGFSLLDGFAYDRLLSFEARIHRTPPQVVLVEIEETAERLQDRTAVQLLETLRAMGSRLVVFNYLPAGEEGRIYQFAARAGDVLFGRPLEPDPLDPELLRPVRLPAGALGHPPRAGAVWTPPASAGIHRAQYTTLEAGGERYVCLEAQAAKLILDKLPDGVGPETYLIGFRGGKGSLPHLTHSRILSGDVLPELIEGKCILVGLKPPSLQPGLATPTTRSKSGMSLLEYQGQALNALLSGRIPKPVPPPLRLAVLLLLAVLAVFSFAWLDVRPATWLAALFACAYAGATSYLLLDHLQWLPPSEGIFATGTLFAISLRRRALKLHNALEQLITEASAQLRDKYWPAHFYSETPPWSLVANMIHQTLDLNRVIFLEVDPGKKRVREIQALGCGLEDIAEQRRDYTRPPYADAVQAKGPIKVKGFLRGGEENEEQYLIPLFFSGELLGFWALAIDSARAETVPQLQALLGDYTARISELLYHARRAREPGNRKRVLMKSFGVEAADAPYEALASTLGLLEHRLRTLETLINRVDAGLIVYDVFGRVLQVNEQMLGLLEKEGLSAFDLTALDLILALSDYDASRTRRLLRHVIAENGVLSLPVQFRSLPQNRYLMHLKPLLDPGLAETGSAALRRIGAKSILCELIETTSLTRLYELKSRLTQRLGLRLRNDLASIDLAASILVSGELTADDRRTLADIIHSKVHQTIGALNECQQFLNTSCDLEDLERFPVDPRPALEAALDEVRPLAEQAGLRVQVMQPHFVSYVLASNERLEQLFKAILRILVRDAAEGSTILVRLNENEETVAFDFSNMGYGIPNELLQEYIFGDEPPASEEFQNLQVAAKTVRSWGGLFEASSGIGVGIHFTIHLPKFI